MKGGTIPKQIVVYYEAAMNEGSFLVLSRFFIDDVYGYASHAKLGIHIVHVLSRFSFLPRRTGSVSLNYIIKLRVYVVYSPGTLLCHL